MVINIIDEGNTTLQLFNIYHQIPKRGYDLHFLFFSKLDKLTPTAIMGDFNTHSP
jgi:hypothetical protein